MKKTLRTGVYWIDGAGALAVALITLCAHLALVAPTLDLRAREDELGARLASMRSNLGALRTRNREFEVRVADARRLVEAQPPLAPSDALLTRRAALTTLLADHDIQLDEFKTAPPPSGARSAAAPAEPAEGKSFVRHRLQIRGEGTFPDIVGLMTVMRERFSDTLIESVEMTGHPFDSSDQRQFTLTFVWYAAPPSGG